MIIKKHQLGVDKRKPTPLAHAKADSGPQANLLQGRWPAGLHANVP
jgi:hypothetical protein